MAVEYMEGVVVVVDTCPLEPPPSEITQYATIANRTYVMRNLTFTHAHADTL